MLKKKGKNPLHKNLLGRPPANGAGKVSKKRQKKIWFWGGGGGSKGATFKTKSGSDTNHGQIVL